MEQLNWANQDNKLLKKVYKKKTQQNQRLVAKAMKQNQAVATEAKIPIKDRGSKSTKMEKYPSRKCPDDVNKTSQAKMQAISVSYIAEFETHSESEESDQEQLHIDILLNMESDNGWLDSQP